MPLDALHSSAQRALALNTNAVAARPDRPRNLRHTPNALAPLGPSPLLTHIRVTIKKRVSIQGTNEVRKTQTADDDQFSYALGGGVESVLFSEPLDIKRVTK